MADGTGCQMQHLRRTGKASLFDHGMKNTVFQQRHDSRSSSSIQFMYGALQMKEFSL